MTNDRRCLFVVTLAPSVVQDTVHIGGIANL